MKLRNKKTGEIFDYTPTLQRWNGPLVDRCHYNSLAELNEEWEDYEEPKSINEIDIVLDAIGEYCNEHSFYAGDLEKIKILNIVEDKLKAWKRLKDKGFKFTGWNKRYCDEINYRLDTTEDMSADLDLLFGGEDE